MCYFCEEKETEFQSKKNISTVPQVNGFTKRKSNENKELLLFFVTSSVTVITSQMTSRATTQLVWWLVKT